MLNRRCVTFIMGLYLFLFFTLYGCEKSVSLPAPSVKQPMKFYKSEQPHIGIYIDASNSMKGYITEGHVTRYASLIDNLESAFAGTWNKTDIKFYRFGEKVEAIKGQLYRQAMLEWFYQTPDLKGKTYIDNVLIRDEICTNNNLSVIITDLHQTGADISKLTRLLSDKCVSTRYAIGILMFRSQFDGIVSDLSIYGRWYPYKSKNNQPETYRPVYILALGNHTDIELFFTKFSQLGDFKAIEKSNVILSPYLVNSISSFKTTSTVHLQTTDRLTRPDSSISHIVKQFNIMKDEKDARVSAKALLEYTPLQYTLPFKPNVETHIKADLYDSTTKTFAASSEAERAIKVTFVSAKQGLDVKTELVPYDLPRLGYYRFTVPISPSLASYDFSMWQNAELDMSQMPKWDAKPETYDGSKTPHIYRFINDIWAAYYRQYTPKIAEVYYYIKR